jgi:transposase
LREKIAQKDNYLQILEEKLRLMLAKTFSPSSEKVSPDQRGLFNEAEDEVAQDLEAEDTETTVVASHQRSKKPLVSIPDELPREDIIHDIPEADKVCPHDGHVLEVIGSDDHEQLDTIPAQIIVLRHRRLKYACPCCDQHIVTASKPSQALKKSIASAGLLAFVATQKYCDALPLYRQTEMFKRIGIELNRTNLANWMIKVGKLVEPLLEHYIAHLQQQHVLHMDDLGTPLRGRPHCVDHIASVGRVRKGGAK